MCNIVLDLNLISELKFNDLTPSELRQLMWNIYQIREKFAEEKMKLITWFSVIMIILFNVNGNIVT